MSDYSGPSGIIKLISERPRLAEFVREQRRDPAEIFEVMRRTLDEKELLPILRDMAAVAISEAIGRERRRVRKKVKDGESVESVFSWMIDDEIEWDQRVAEMERDQTQSMLASISSILTRWKLDDGTPLGMATAGYVRKVAAHERALSNGHLRNANFYDAIASGIPDGEKIGDHVSVNTAEALRLRFFDDSHGSDNRDLGEAA